MLYDQKQVAERRDSQRQDADQYFIPLGSYNTDTPSVKDISNLTCTLHNHLPLVKAAVDATVEAGIPVYVGYDGKDIGSRHGTYTDNLILLHQSADDSTLAFIVAYTHELVHMDQDRRGLLREHEVPPSPAQMVNFLAHNLMLEAAALATEAVSLYYLSERSALRDVNDEVEEYFDEYAAALPTGVFMRVTIEDALDGKRGKDFQSLKPAWQAVFQSFFAPDSKYLANYIQQFTAAYLSAASDQTTRKDRTIPDHEWGGINELREITTMTGWGPMFPQGALPVLLRQIRAAIVQDKHLSMIDLARNHVRCQPLKAERALEFLNVLKF